MRTSMFIGLVVLLLVVGATDSYAKKARGSDDEAFVTSGTCDGDLVPDDGIKGGTCTTGPHTGMPCDATRLKPPGTSSDCASRPTGTQARTAAEDSELTAQRNAVLAGGCPGGFPLPIAFTVWGRDHHTSGQDVLLPYPVVGGTPGNPVTNEGGGWMSPSNFVAPCAGLYMFTVEFEKDAFYYGGTTDDVSVILTKTVGVSNPVYIGEAWSGEGDGYRGTGAYSAILRLGVGDSVQTYVHSDGPPPNNGYMRHLAYYNFTGHRIAN